MLILIFNGPPDSGKDTCAKYLSEKHGYTHLEMKGSLRKLAHQMASIATGDLKAAEELCNHLEYGVSADNPNLRLKNTEVRSEFGGRTWREFLIWISEKVCKPVFGSDIFSMAAVKAIRDSKSAKIAFSDCGFQIELDTIRSLLSEEYHIRLVRLFREGFNFASDSRNYVRAPFEDTYEIDNTGLDDLLTKMEVLNKKLSWAYPPYEL